MTAPTTQCFLKDTKSLEGLTIDKIFPYDIAKAQTTRHSLPCPPSDDQHGVDEWVLNHLPLTTEQKKTLLDQLVADQLKETSAHKRKKARLVRVIKRDPEEPEHRRQDVKTQTKSQTA